MKDKMYLLFIIPGIMLGMLVGHYIDEVFELNNARDECGKVCGCEYYSCMAENVDGTDARIYNMKSISCLVDKVIDKSK